MKNSIKITDYTLYSGSPALGNQPARLDEVLQYLNTRGIPGFSNSGFVLGQSLLINFNNNAAALAALENVRRELHVLKRFRS